MKREIFTSGTPWEPLAGYARAVRLGRWVFVSGTTATDEDGNLVGIGDAEAQARRILQNIDRALQRAGATLQDVVRTRIYLTDIGDWQAVARVHGELFGDIRPASTLVAVASLIEPAMLVEMEVDALLEG